MKFPVARSLKMIEGGGTRIVRTDGTNLLLETHLLRLLHGSPLFAPFNRLAIRARPAWPLKFFSQFFFMVLVRKERPDPRP
jgi:hypothetical protein